MRRRRFSLVFQCVTAFLALASALVLLTGTVALASEGGGNAEQAGHAEHHAVHFGMSEVFQIINFILLICLLVYVYKKFAGDGFEKRSVGIRMAMEEAAEARRKAEEKHKEYQARLAQLDREIQGLVDRAREDAAQEREKLIAQAHQQAEKLVKQAELSASQEVETAKVELRKEAAELAAGMAAEVLKKAITAEDQRSWVETYIEKIGELR